jgi:hypothetical protein
VRQTEGENVTEDLIIGLLFIIVVLLIVGVIKLHQMSALFALAKTGATTIVSDIEAVIAKHKGA